MGTDVRKFIGENNLPLPEVENPKLLHSILRRIEDVRGAFRRVGADLLKLVGMGNAGQLADYLLQRYGHSDEPVEGYVDKAISNLVTHRGNGGQNEGGE